MIASHALRVACCICVLWAEGRNAAAQAVPAATQPVAVVRLVSAQQGRAIVDAALQQDQPARGTQDCSHLVHDIYLLAGYEYPYASSFELYAGHENFRRVRYPQPGDLITWPGHVGIVLEPRQHTFYSLVRSGLQAEDYRGPYWRSRGRPRFYRYVADTGSRMETAEARYASPPRAPAARSHNTTAVAERAEPETSSSKAAVQEASERTPVVASGNVGANNSAAEAIPSSILISAEQRKPTADEVADGISELSNAAASVLSTDEPLRLPEPVVIFDELRVERVEIKRDKGWAHLQIDSHVRIAGEGPDFKRRHEKVRWELRRSENGWTAIAPPERKYVSRDVAVRVLATQLAQMAQSEGAARHEEAMIDQEARIVNLLSALLEK
jgi:NlpC/P60 family